LTERERERASERARARDRERERVHGDTCITCNSPQYLLHA
jgi:hypothetical protein